MTGWTVTGTIDTTTADNGRILWSNGTVWLRMALGGQWVVSGNVPSSLGSITQSGTALTFSGPSGNSSGSITGSTQVSAYGTTGTLVNGTTIQFTNGQVWTKLDLAPTYVTSAGGGTTQVIQNGTTTLGFVSSLGQSFSGNFTDPTHLVVTSAATGFAVGTTATVGGGQIAWSTGEVWSENFSVQGTIGPSGVVSISVTPAGITLTNERGAISRAAITGPNTIVALDWHSLVGTRTNGGISWANGTAWTNFDFNALDAMFG